MLFLKTPASRSASTTRLRAMFEAHYQVVWRVVRRMGLPSDAADDVTQQVFVVAAERLEDIAEGAERAFLCATAYRTVQSTRRKHQREPLLADDREFESASVEPAPDDQLEQKRHIALLDSLLSQLPLELRIVFTLYEIEGLTSPEIAQIVAIPVGTVASRLRRAREAFELLVANCCSSFDSSETRT